MRRLRDQLTYANVMATIAVFIALGGAAYAAVKLPKNSVGTKQLKKDSVTSAKVKTNTLKASDLQPGVIPAPVDAYTKAQGDARYLGTTVVVTKTVADGMEVNKFKGGSVRCPSGYQAIGGGVEPDGVLSGKVSTSVPLVDGKALLEVEDGIHGPSDGWLGIVSTDKATSGTGPIRVAVICSPIG